METVKMQSTMSISSLASLFSLLEIREIKVDKLLVNENYMRVIKNYIDEDPKPYPGKYVKIWGANIEIADINGAVVQNLEKNEQAILEISSPKAGSF